MPYTRRTWKDEIVQYPSRYQLKDTGTGAVVATYDLQRTTGTVTEPADIINAVKLNNIEAGVQELSNAVFSPSNITTTLNSTAPIVSVTDSVDGMVDVEVGGATLNQVVVNGDFANGTTGWTVVGGTASVTSKLYTFTANGTVADPYPYAISLKAATKYFVKARMRVTSAGVVTLRLGTNVTTITTIISPVQNQWYDLFAVFTTTTDTQLRLRPCYTDPPTANGKVMEVDGNVGVFAIPITDTPYESMTADQINNIVGEYWEGLKSVERADVISVGRNLFDINSQVKTGSFNVSDDVTDNTLNLRSLASNTTAYRVFTVKLKPNTQYRISFQSTRSGSSGGGISVFDKNITSLIAGNPNGLNGNFTFTTPSNGVVAILCYAKSGTANLDSATFTNVMLTETTASHTFQPYDGSKLSVRCNDRTKFDLPLIPNLKDNEVNVARGYISAVKRVQRYVLQASDITGFGTGTVNNRIITKTSLLPNSKAFTNGIDLQTATSLSFKETDPDIWDTSAESYTYQTAADNSIRFIYPLGTYPNLAAAQAALAGTVIYYELATPIFIPYEQFDDYGIDVDGILSSSDDYTQFYLDNYNLLPPTPIMYPANINASVQSLKNGLEVVNTKADDLEAKKANLDGDNFFNGNQFVTGNVRVDNGKAFTGQTTGGSEKNIATLFVDDKIYYGASDLESVFQGTLSVLGGRLWTSVNQNLQGSVSVTNASWVASGNTRFPFKKDVAITGVVATDSVEMNITLGTYTIAENAGLSTVNDAYAGGVTIYSTVVPSGTITFDYVITKGA